MSYILYPFTYGWSVLTGGVAAVWSWLTILETGDAQTVLDLLILIVALLPSLFISYKMMFATDQYARRLYNNRKIVNWLFFLCGVEIIFYTMKVPLIYKIIVFIIMLIPLFIVAEVLK
jgi:hypothetical protein